MDTQYEQLEARFDVLSESVGTQINTINLSLAGIQNSLNTIATRLNTLQLNGSSLQSQINGISNAVNSGNTRMTNIQSSLGSIESRVAALESGFTALSEQMESETDELHGEIHTVADNVDEHTSSILTMAVSQSEMADSITDLGTVTDTIQNDMQAMDEEHHEELHLLANGIDGHTDRIEQLELNVAAIPEHVVLSEEEWEAITEPDVTKFYFVYED